MLDKALFSRVGRDLVGDLKGLVPLAEAGTGAVVVLNIDHFDLIFSGRLEDIHGVFDKVVVIVERVDRDPLLHVHYD